MSLEEGREASETKVLMTCNLSGGDYSNMNGSYKDQDGNWLLSSFISKQVYIINYLMIIN